MLGGTSVGGPQTITLAPSFSRPWMLLRATRLWAMSPTRPTVSPSTRPLIRRMVKMSSSPCVGCSWAPSPALTTLQCRCWASRCGAPGTEWRTTTTSMPIASMFLAVSMNVSPLLTLEPPAVKSRVSALSRLAARPKLVRVRVDGSKNRLTTTLPLRSARFLRRRWLTSTKSSAVSRMVSISARLEVFQAEQVAAGPRDGSGSGESKFDAHDGLPGQDRRFSLGSRLGFQPDRTD